MANAPSEVRAAVVQTTSSDDVAANIAQTEGLVREAANQGATLVVLPEKWNVIDTDDRQASRAEALDGPSLRAASDWARELGITLVAGSVSEQIDDDARAANTCVVITPDGRQVAIYRKMHLFDVTVGAHQYRESAGTLPGDDVVTVDVADHRLGLAICYDLRFPELFRALSARGADILTLPAAFTAPTGAAHWEILVRARAIENQAFVLAAGQVGLHATETASFGQSMIVDPWGVVVASVPDGIGVAVADLDFSARADLMARLPVLQHRQIHGVRDRP
jgi:predicted amidohydrolase